MTYVKKNNRPPRKGEGRPSKYKPEYCQEIIKYFDIEHYKIIQIKTKGKNFEKIEEKEVANSLQFISGFARKIDVNVDTLREWKANHPEFSAAFTRAKELQHEMMVNNASKGLYNPNFLIFAMKNMHEWRDRTEIDHGLTDETYEKYKSLSVDELMEKVKNLIPAKK